MINQMQLYFAIGATILVNACETQAQNLATRSVLQKICTLSIFGFNSTFKVFI